MSILKLQELNLLTSWMQFNTKLYISMSFENAKLISSSHSPDRLSKMKADFDH